MRFNLKCIPIFHFYKCWTLRNCLPVNKYTQSFCNGSATQLLGYVSKQYIKITQWFIMESILMIQSLTSQLGSPSIWWKSKSWKSIIERFQKAGPLGMVFCFANINTNFSKDPLLALWRFFVCFGLGATAFCNSCFVLKGSLRAVIEKSYMVPEIEPKSSVCEGSALPSVYIALFPSLGGLCKLQCNIS